LARFLQRLREQGIYDHKMQTRQLEVKASEILDVTTPEDILFNEATEALKKYDKKE